MKSAGLEVPCHCLLGEKFRQEKIGQMRVELQKDVLMPILSFEVTILVDPARSHSQAAQASAAAKIKTPGANRKLVKFHKDICSQ